MKLRSTTSSQFARLALLVSMLGALCGNSPAQDFKTLHPGIEYAHVDHKIGSDPVKINLLRLDLKKVRLDIHHAFDRAVGVKTTSEIAKDNNAVAAINAGFFRLDKSEFNGDAAGVLVIDGELISESTNDRMALILFSTAHRTYRVEFEHVTARPKILPVAVPPFSLDGINRERKKGEMILYSPRFGATTLTKAGGTEIILHSCKKNTCDDFEILNGVGNHAIPSDGYVLSIDADQSDAQRKFVKGLEELRKVKDRRFLIEHVTKPFDYLYTGRKPILDIAGRIPFKGMKSNTDVDIVAGVPQLIRNGKIDITWEQEKASKSFAETRHPRTAVAKLKDGKFLMITVDGRQPSVSVGMTLKELAEYLLSLGATDAMNLDGGGSTTMYVDGKVVNTPSEKDGERKVSDAIVVTLRAGQRQ